MPDINNTPLKIGAGVTVTLTNPLDERHKYDALHGTITYLFPSAGLGALVEVRFDDRLLGNALFYGYELLMDQLIREK